jgi:tetratricopeptide (TPR) repeat protein
MAATLKDQGRFADADRALTEALQITQSTGTQNTLDGAHLFLTLGQLELSRANLEQANSYLTRALKIAGEIAGPRDPQVAAILAEISNARSWMDDLDGAERAAREAVSIYRQLVDEHHPDRVMADYLLARVLNLQGRTDEAAALYENVLTAQRLLFGDMSVRVGATVNGLAQVRLNQERLDEAEPLIKEALELNQRARGDTHYMTGYLWGNLARVHLRQGQLEKAETEVRTALAIFARTLPADHQYVATCEYLMGEIMLAMNRLPDAETLLTASMNRWKRTDAPAWRAARSASALGETLHRAGRMNEAEKYLLEGLYSLTFGRGIDRHTRITARERLAHYYLDTGQRDKFNEIQVAVSRDDSAPAVRPLERATEGEALVD